MSSVRGLLRKLLCTGNESDFILLCSEHAPLIFSTKNLSDSYLERVHPSLLELVLASIEPFADLLHHRPVIVLVHNQALDHAVPSAAVAKQSKDLLLRSRKGEGDRS